MSDAETILLARMDELLRRVDLLSERLGERALSTDEVGRMAGCSSRTVQRRINEGRLAPTSPAPPFRVLISEVERAIRSGDL